MKTVSVVVPTASSLVAPELVVKITPSATSDDEAGIIKWWLSVVRCTCGPWNIRMYPMKYAYCCFLLLSNHSSWLVHMIYWTIFFRTFKITKRTSLDFSHRSVFGRAPRQPCCWDAWQMWERYVHYDIQSRGFQCSQDFTARRLTD